MLNIENMKAERDGLVILSDLQRFANEGLARIGEADIARLRWAGLFLRQATPGHFMLRVRVPGGRLSYAQWHMLGELSRSYGRSLMDLTTRQGVQLRWIRIEDVPAIFAQLASVDLSPLQTGLDNVRNVMSCPVAALDAREWADVSAVVKQVDDMIVGNTEFSNLPRKFNISIVGCPDDCGHSEINDIGVTPALTLDGQVRFRVKVGGALGPTYHRMARALPGVIELSEIPSVCRTILELFRDHGLREKRHKARLFHLIDEWGWDRFVASVKHASAASFADLPLRSSVQGYHRDHLGVYEEKDASRAYVGLHVPVGSMTATDWLALGDLSLRYAGGEMRLTPAQNIVMAHVQRALLDDLSAEPILKRYSPDPLPFMRKTVSCTGRQFCDKAVIETKQHARALAEYLDANVASPSQSLHIHWSGCPNSCGQHQIADIGLRGTKVRVDGQMVEAVDIYLGGRLTSGLGPRLYRERVPVQDLKDVMGRLIDEVRDPTSEHEVNPIDVLIAT